MAYISQVHTTTTTNTSLTAATLVETFTNTTRIRKLWVNVFADQVKGNGDYIANIRVQRAGTGSEYVSIKTTLALASGVTAGYFGSIPITLNATDVLKVYLLGTAADSDSTADVIVDVNEEWQSTDANGALLLQPTQTGVTIPTVTTLTNDAGITQAGADKVWGTTVRTLTAFGFTVAANLTQILGTALTETVSGYLAAGFKKLHDVATPVFTLASLNQTGDTFSKFGGITLLANWLRGLARKDAMNATAKAELNSGSGTFDEATDSTEALRDRGDAAWITGGAGLSAQDVRDAMKLAPTAGAPVATSIDDKLNNLTPGAPINLVVEETDIVVNP